MEAARELDRVPKTASGNMVVALQIAVGPKIECARNSIDFDI